MNSIECGTHLSSLLEWLLVDGEKDDGVGAKTVLSGGLHVLDDVFALREVNKGERAELLAHLLLLLTSINGNGSKTHGLCVLLSKRTKTTTGADNGDGLARASARLLQALVDSDTGAQDRRDGVKRDVLGNAGNVRGFGNAVLLERSVDSVSREQSFRAELYRLAAVERHDRRTYRFIGLLAEIARETGSIDPLDTGMVTDFDIVDELSFGNNDTRTLVSSDQWHL